MRKTAVIIMLLLLSASVHAEELAGIDILRSIQEAFTSVAAEVSPAVVYIEVKSETDKRMSFFFGPWGFEPPPEQEGAGSGFIIDPEGYIVTNAHVVAKAKEIKVTLADERSFGAELIGMDPDSDLALIRIQDARDLPVARLGDSDRVRVGEWALAIGSPFGLQQTVTAGIISATGRTNMGLANYEDFIQTDASINPGNSGGPLVNLDGEVIGVNSAIRSGSDWMSKPYNVGIGFAIPINMARRVIADLREKGGVVRGWLGVSIQNVTDEMARAMNLKENKGALVAEVLPGSPAEKSGFEVGDVVLEMNGTRVKDANELKNRVALLVPGERVEFLVNREGRQSRIDVTIGERPSDLTAYYEKERRAESRAVASLGLEVQNVDPQLAKEMGLDKEEGVIITRVLRGSPAEKAGLRSRDVIVQFDRREVKSADELEKMAERVVEGEPVLVLVWRDGRTTFLVIEK
ncbi:MAG TPA: DegQ family serine endoprotease [Candidatus Coatesbacteria bacterium]|nr:DegQ family serine endoprotease [Candidatus Coatesbacteria bacterium]